MEKLNIEYIVVDEKNGVLKVPNELAGRVATLLKEKLGIEIKEAFEKWKSSPAYIEEMQYISTLLLNQFYKYSQFSGNVEVFKFMYDLKLKSNQKKLIWKHLYYLINFSDIKTKFRMEWDQFLRNGEAKNTLNFNFVREKIRQQNSKWISLMIFENQKKVPYQVLKKQLSVNM